MTTRDFTANVISASKVVPDGNFKDSKASGVWDINEALDLIKSGNWPNVANINPSAFVDALFSTDLYEGNATARTITTNIDVSNNGGLVWIKARNSGEQEHNLYDTARGAGERLISHTTSAESTETQTLKSFTSSGFTLGTSNMANQNGKNFVSWSFRKQPKFFDVVTYQGTGSARTVAHSLNTTVGMILVKNRDAGDNWAVYHRGDNGGSSPDNFYMSLNLTDASNNSATRWNDTAPTSSVFTVGTDHSVNASGENYVAYLFAHNNDDGGFGAAGDQDIIKCGTYTGNGSTQSIALGFEPQFVLLKNTGNGTGSSSNWVMFDNMRGVVTSSNAADDKYLFPNSATSEGGGIPINFTATGFDLDNEDTSNKNTDAFIYMAIRRGGMQTPTTASDVFAMDTAAGTSPSPPHFNSGFPVDFEFYRDTDGAADWYAGSRLTGTKFLRTNTDDAEQNDNTLLFDYQNGFYNASYTDATTQAWMWKRARGYFDVVAYSGTGSARTVSHNLGVVPEMMWIKNRDASENWPVYHKGLDGGTNPETHYIRLNQTNAEADSADWWNDTAPTASVFTVGTQGQVNTNTQKYIAYLFATAAGVSKVGSYTGNGSTTGPTIDCGFTNGPSFVLIKRSSSGTGGWYLYDSVRGIADGNESNLYLNANSAEQSAFDQIDPTSSGFQLVTNASNLNGDGETFIFYAIAAIS